MPPLGKQVGSKVLSPNLGSDTPLNTLLYPLESAPTHFRVAFLYPLPNPPGPLPFCFSGRPNDTLIQSPRFRVVCLEPHPSLDRSCVPLSRSHPVSESQFYSSSPSSLLLPPRLKVGSLYPRLPLKSLAEDNLEPVILLPAPLECWDHRCTLQCLASEVLGMGPWPSCMLGGRSLIN